MIKETELRIGNFISEYLDEGFITIVADNDTFRQVETYPSTFEPIPLTEEWLLKLGFEKKQNYFNGDISFSANGVWLHPDDEGFSFYYAENKTKISYVHQLQNLYFCLVGEELKINTNVAAVQETL